MTISVCSFVNSSKSPQTNTLVWKWILDGRYISERDINWFYIKIANKTFKVKAIFDKNVENETMPQKNNNKQNSQNIYYRLEENK